MPSIFIPTATQLKERGEALVRGEVGLNEFFGDFRRAVGLSAVGARAEGGFVGSPELSWIGEDGPEYVIPVGSSRRQRGLDLWVQAGRSLGAVGGSGSGSGALPEITINYNPTVNASTDSDFGAILREHSQSICVMVIDALNEREFNERRVRMV
jgi:SLT domain-containing protein